MDNILLFHLVIFKSCPTSRNERLEWTTFYHLVSSQAVAVSPPALGAHLIGVNTGESCIDFVLLASLEIVVVHPLGRTWPL